MRLNNQIRNWVKMLQLQIITYSNVVGKKADEEVFVNLMEGIPTLPALEFVVEKQNRVMFAFADIETQKEAIYEMRCYLGQEEQANVDAFLGNMPAPILLMNLSCMEFCAQVLRTPNTEARELSKEEIRKVYLAYLICNEKWSSHQADGFKVDPDHPENMLLKVDMPLSEFKRHKDFKAAIYKATQLFRFCEKNGEYWAIVSQFLADHGVNDWREYLMKLFELYFKSIGIKEQQLSSQITPFEEQYAIDLSQMTNDETLNIMWLRDHFLVKRADGTFLVINNNLIIDKMYQGLKFDLFKTAKNHHLTIDGDEIKSVDKLNEKLGQDFSEEYLLYDLMEKIYSGHQVIKFKGKELQGKIDAEPDYYLRQGKQLLLIEHKDVLISEIKKQETDVSMMIDALSDKICREKDEKKGRKGGPQLLYTIDGIFKRESMQHLDSDAKKANLVYPVVTVLDSTFSSLGVALATVRKFCEQAQGYDTIKEELTHVAPITIIDIDTLFILSKRLHDGELDLFNLIGEYQRVLCTKSKDVYEQPSFSSFIADNYSLKEIKEEDDGFLLSNYYEEITGM